VTLREAIVDGRSSSSTTNHKQMFRSKEVEFESVIDEKLEHRET
jgi:hypothetical protein